VRVLVAPDKFRGTVTAPQAAAAIGEGITDAGGEPRLLPLADGGEGTLDAFGGANRWTAVTGPDEDPVTAGWRMGDEGTAVIEMAMASGLLLVGGRDKNDPWAASTAGTGELIREATRAGARRIIVGLGGSATTDGGFGALRELLNDPIWRPGIAPADDRPELLVCCDVNTVFTAAAAVFGPQKGADDAMVATLTNRLEELERAYRVDYGIDLAGMPGAGAAGGLAGGLAVIGGRITPGFQLIADLVGLDEALAKSDLVITGEGHLDSGSFNGKVVGGVAQRAAAANVPVIALVGVSTAGEFNQLTVHTLVERFGAERAMRDTAQCLQLLAAEVHSRFDAASHPSGSQ
jgi:glycerate 2-kinase